MNAETDYRSDLSLTNTLTREKEIFKSIEDWKVKLFTCGPSIYRRPHIGNYGTFLFEDILQRYLEYLGYDVRRVINFTDLEDKALDEAREKGLTVQEVTEAVAEEFFKDAALLKLKLPDSIPRSSTSVDKAVELIKKLVDKGYAYRHGKDIFYDPLKFKGFGKLFGLDMSRWPEKKRRFRKDTYPGQRWNFGDFILWHGIGDEDNEKVYWETDIGKGRPSWNIQDPAIISKHLGFQIDICCGGIDNLYRHHDYTIAVMEAISEKTFSRYWLHGEHVVVHGAKMSKSKGNIVYPQNLLSQGFSAEQLRFFLIYGHYRKRKNLTEKNIRYASKKLDSLQDTVRKTLENASQTPRPTDSASSLLGDLNYSFKTHMNNDLDVKGAFDAIYEKLSELLALKNREGLNAEDCRKIKQTLVRIDKVFQVIFPSKGS